MSLGFAAYLSEEHFYGLARDRFADSAFQSAFDDQAEPRYGNPPGPEIDETGARRKTPVFFEPAPAEGNDRTKAGDRVLWRASCQLPTRH
jgi:hypothetical protein